MSFELNVGLDIRNLSVGDILYYKLEEILGCYTYIEWVKVKVTKIILSPCPTIHLNVLEGDTKFLFHEIENGEDNYIFDDLSLEKIE